MTCAEALELGTLHGARCLGREDELGTLEAGKLADVVLWRLDDLDRSGIEDPVAALVLGPRPLADTVIVDGQVVIRGGELLTGDEQEIAHELAEVALR
jgi:imidazolonepropionase-like amidohydrolase